jgi:hypothetical protein
MGGGPGRVRWRIGGAAATSLRARRRGATGSSSGASAASDRAKLRGAATAADGACCGE